MSNKTYKFEHTFCSQCGQEFGPGDHGFSHCSSHLQDVYRGNKTITVKELRELLAPYDESAEVVFHVDVDPSSSFYHCDSVEAGLLEEPVKPFINLTPR